MIHLKDLITVLDADTYFTLHHGYNEVFQGIPKEFDKPEFDSFAVKAVWFSKIYNSLMIEI